MNVVRVVFQRLVIKDDRIRHVALSVDDCAQRIPELRIGRVDVDGAAQQLNGLIDLAGFAQGGGQVIDGLDMTGAFIEEEAEELFRQVGHAHAIGETAYIVCDGGIVRRQL